VEKWPDIYSKNNSKTINNIESTAETTISITEKNDNTYNMPAIFVNDVMDN